jgi:hypothetical protein
MNGVPKRHRLPNRRAHLVLDFEHGGFSYTAGVGFFDDAGQEPAEIFLTTAKHGTVLDSNARDAAIAASLLLQHGCPLDTLRRALMRNSDGWFSFRAARTRPRPTPQTDGAANTGRRAQVS